MENKKLESQQLLELIAVVLAYKWWKKPKVVKPLVKSDVSYNLGFITAKLFRKLNNGIRSRKNS